MVSGVIILYCLGVGTYGLLGYMLGYAATNLALLIVKAIFWPISLVLRLIKWTLGKVFGFITEPVREYHEDKVDYKRFIKEQQRQEDYNRRADKWDKQRGIDTRNINH